MRTLGLNFLPANSDFFELVIVMLAALAAALSAFLTVDFFVLPALRC